MSNLADGRRKSHAACLPWLHQRRVALLSSDSDSDVHPPLPEFKRWSEPVHMIAIPYMGMPLLCIAGLDEISAACSEERRWHFFLSIAPWRFKGATSSRVIRGHVAMTDAAHSPTDAGLTTPMGI